MALPISRLIVALTDKVSGPAKAVAASLHGVRQAAQGSFGMRIGAPAGLQQASMVASQLRGNLVDAGAMAYGAYKAISGPITASARFQTVLTDIRQKADMTAQEISALGGQFRKLAPEVNLSATEVAKAADILMGMGLDPKRTLEILKPIGMVATAYGAEVEDVSKMTFAMLDNLKIRAADIPNVLDMTALAGKEGAFELKDMSRHFAGLTAQMQAMKMTGPGAAAKLGAYLQVVRKTAGNSDEAANNLRNLFTKMYSDDTVKDFKKVGINIRKELDKAEDPIERFVQLAYEKFGGNKSELAEVLGDQQAQLAALAIIQNPNMATDIVLKALKAQGVVLADFNMRMTTTEARVKTFRNRMEDIGISVGSALEPGLAEVLDTIEIYVAKFGKFADKNPKLISSIVKVGAALIGLRLAVAAGRFALFGLTQPILLVAGFFGRMLVGSFRAVLHPIALVTRALGILRGALMLSGIGVLLVAIGAAGKFIHDNWSGLGAFFDQFGKSFRKGLGEDGSKSLENFILTVERIGKWMAGDSWKIDDSQWATWGEGAGTAAAKMAIKIVDAMDRIIAGIERVKETWRTVMYAITGDAQYAPPVRPQQQAWRGEGDTVEPTPQIREASFEPSIDIVDRETDPDFQRRMVRASLFPRGTTIWDQKEDQAMGGHASMMAGIKAWAGEKNQQIMEGDAALRASIADLPLGDKWFASQIAKIRDFTQSIPLSDAWIAARLGGPAGSGSPSATDTASTAPIGDAAGEFAGLDKTISPQVSTSGVDRFIAKVKEAREELGRLMEMGAGLGSPEVGGQLGRARRGSFATE
jgi:TP901 family phage tail tape measure protein